MMHANKSPPSFTDTARTYSDPKAPCVEPAGETERAAAAMRDAIEPRAQAEKGAAIK